MERVILKHYYQVYCLMIGKKKLSQIKSLAQKKFRQKEKLFLAEGDKIVLEVLTSQLVVKELYATTDFLTKYKKQVTRAEKIVETSFMDIKRASLLKAPQNCLVLCSLPDEESLPTQITGISFYLDGIQDPGNLGTILRICDWFGMKYCFCSPETADIYNPKVVQSSMGSFCRIRTIYTSFEKLSLSASYSQVPVFGTFLDGESLYSSILPSRALIVMGNEGNGIRTDVANQVSNKLSIPSFNFKRNGAESLNVAVAAGIIANEFHRQLLTRPSIQNGNKG